MRKHFRSICTASLVILTGCSGNNHHSDAYGNFEAVEVTVSAESNGKIISLNLEEGQTLLADAVIGLIDTSDLTLRKAQTIAQREAAATRIVNIQSQINVQLQQRTNLNADKERIRKLLTDGAATTKQMDDLNANLDLLDKQISATKTQSLSVQKELIVYDRQIEQIDENISKCRIINPISGTVLNKFVETGEITAYGKPLYNIADLSVMELRVFVSGDQLPNVRLGEPVEVLIDRDRKTNSTLEGTVSWISPSAEFTPKTIQTKAERVSLVYAVKVRVMNDGTLKIGMPGEVNFLLKSK
ncbi:MAG: HlyD family efflux transporter periplasmic adaptor subunit [Candidatus Neomarinimicrobiota bacterium]